MKLPGALGVGPGQRPASLASCDVSEARRASSHLQRHSASLTRPTRAGAVQRRSSSFSGSCRRNSLLAKKGMSSPGDFLKGAPVAPGNSSKAGSRAIQRRRQSTVAVVEAGEDAGSTALPNDTFQMWDKTTNTLTACSTVANLLMMMPQIFKNASSLIAQQPTDLAGLSYIAFSTGFLGNMLLLSYFTEQRQLSACLVQVVGATSTLTLLIQIWMAGYMPLPAFAAVSSYFILGCLVNGLRYTGALPQAAWGVWQDFIGVLGLAVLPQVLWSSFSPVQTPLPGIVAGGVGVLSVVQVRTGKASKSFVNTWQKLSGWTATLLFMFMPVAQLKSCLANPANLAGLSPVSSVLGLLGNGLMVPRALFTRDLIWFTGSSWGALMMGWGMLLAMTLYSYFPGALFAAITLGWFAYLATVLIMNARAHKLPSPLASIFFLRP